MLEQVTPLILTYNEAPNIRRTLEQLRWARDIVVVDSGSQDETRLIVSSFPQARVFEREFDNFANQCNFGLSETGIATEWVLNLDADYVLTDEFVQEIGALDPRKDLAGLRSKFIYCIYGRRLRCGVYPPVTVLFRKSTGIYRQDGHAHRVVVNGRVEDLHSPILHDDRKSLSHWFQAQSRYTELEAKKLLTSNPDALSWTDRIRRWRIVAPPAMLLYCLLIRGGILDGWAGFYYAFQRALAELMLSLYLIDNDLRTFAKPSPQRHRGNFGIRNSEFGFGEPAPQRPGEHRAGTEQNNQPQMNADNTDQKSEEAKRQITESVVS